MFSFFLNVKHNKESNQETQIKIIPGGGGNYRSFIPYLHTQSFTLQ